VKFRAFRGKNNNIIFLEELPMTNEDIGYVYILRNKAMPDIYKIGITSREDLNKRIDELYTGQTSVPLPFECEFACQVNDYKQVERIIHKAFEHFRINPNREFFRINPDWVKPLLEHLQIEDETEDLSEKIDKSIDPIDKESSVKYRKYKSKFNFVEMGINVGETIIFVNDESKQAEVIENNLVKYNDNKYSLTGLTKELLGKSDFGQPVKYWKYKDKSLLKIYKETYTR